METEMDRLEGRLRALESGFREIVTDGLAKERETLMAGREAEPPHVVALDALLSRLGASPPPV
jgi:hypothetical protein